MRGGTRYWLGLVGVLFGVLSCSRDTRATSILLVTLDTTRADRIGCYGRAEAGTPALDALAARGARFERAYTVAPITLPAHASLLTGSYPPHHGLRDNGLSALDESVETIAETCRRSGLRTAAFVSGFPVSRLFGLGQGFEHYDDFFGSPGGPRGAIRERPGDITAGEAEAWLATLEEGEAFFLWVHLFDPHDPYEAPEAFARRFPGDPYQAEVSFADSAVGQLLGALERLGRSSDTLVAVAADHGESLGEHEEETHAILLYDGTMRVPLLLAGPGVEARVLSESVSLVDLAPTLIELARIDDGGVFSSHFGASLAPLLRGEEEVPRTLYIETYFPRLHFGWSELVGLVRGEWKYVEARGERADGVARAELHAPASDPGEHADLAPKEPERVREMRSELAEFRRALQSDAAPSVRRTQSAEELEALAALGYGGADVLAPLPGAEEESPPGKDPRRVVAAVSLLNAVRTEANAGRYEEADRLLGRLEELQPGAVLVHEARGDFHLARGRGGARADLQEAAEAFAAATELEPGRRGLWLRRSAALQGLGRLREALDCVDRALELAPPTPEFTRGRDELQRRLEESESQ